MTVRIFFQDFEAAIQERFSRAVADAGDEARHLTLELIEKPYEGGWAAEFSVTPPNGPVRITWAGIASLWACAQGAVRLSRRMFEAKRQKAPGDKLFFSDDQELEFGRCLMTLSERLCRTDFPTQPMDATKWVDWAPEPDFAPTNIDSQNGNNFFYGALSWIMRHEIAHVVLQHSVAVYPMEAEIDADRQATEWLRGGRESDPHREPGTRPDSEEIELEQRALVIGIALIWIAIFETLVGRLSATHPPTAERFFRCINALKLREDSAAAEILHDILQVWLDPTGSWAPQSGYPTAQTALDSALSHLYDRLKRKA
jgi:Peptidase U49